MSAPHLDIALHRAGGGEPLVLLHGIGHRWQAWRPVLDRLAEHHDVLAVDLPGFGASPLPPDPPTMAGTVASIAGFLAAELAERPPAGGLSAAELAERPPAGGLSASLGIRRPHVAGNSLGGAIALELAAAGQAASVTALSPAGFATGWERRWALGVLRTHRLTARVPEPVLRHAARSPRLRALCWGMIVGRPELLDPEEAAADARALRDGPGFPSVARAARGYRCACVPPVPVTVAWGTRDRILLPRQARRARALLPDARHVALPGCGHVPMSDAPDLVARLILETTGALRVH
jgi:pimeloyl-ACP methyl ester carboxylesterase